MEIVIKLPTDFTALKKDFVEILSLRSSIRRFVSKPLGLGQLSCVLWACQGKRDIRSKKSSKRNVPSAGATYPIVTYVVYGASTDPEIKPGLYRYHVDPHALEKISDGDLREDVASACFSQNFITEAPASIVIAADYAVTTRVYGERGVRYVHMEAGHSGQNIYLACAAMGLGTVAVGAFNDEAVARVLNLPLNLEPVYVFPIGYPR